MSAKPILTPHRRAVLAGAAGVGLLAGGATLARSRPLVLERPLLDDVLTLRGDPRFAGAVSSLTFRGTEYVDAADHGRLMQSALHFNGRGECLNPTQGGASSDGRRSTSRLLSSETTPDAYAVRTQMAYWLRPGQFCDLPGGRARAANARRLSDTTVDVRHRFGALPAANAVLSEIEFNSASRYIHAVIEALTVYTPAQFDRLYVWRAGRFEPTEPRAEQPDPYALATADGRHAVALFAPRGAVVTPPVLFGGFSYGVTGKLNAVHRRIGFGPSGAAYRLAWAVGTLEEVRAALAACAA